MKSLKLWIIALLCLVLPFVTSEVVYHPPVDLNVSYAGNTYTIATPEGNLRLSYLNRVGRTQDVLGSFTKRPLFINITSSSYSRAFQWLDIDADFPLTASGCTANYKSIYVDLCLENESNDLLRVGNRLRARPATAVYSSGTCSISGTENMSTVDSAIGAEFYSSGNDYFANCTLQVNASATLEVDSGETLTVEGDLSIYGTMNVDRAIVYMNVTDGAFDDVNIFNGGLLNITGTATSDTMYVNRNDLNAGITSEAGASYVSGNDHWDFDCDSGGSVYVRDAYLENFDGDTVDIDCSLDLRRFLLKMTNYYTQGTPVGTDDSIIYGQVQDFYNNGAGATSTFFEGEQSTANGIELNNVHLNMTGAADMGMTFSFYTRYGYINDSDINSCDVRWFTATSTNYNILHIINTTWSGDGTTDGRNLSNCDYDTGGAGFNSNSDFGIFFWLELNVTDTAGDEVSGANVTVTYDRYNSTFGLLESDVANGTHTTGSDGDITDTNLMRERRFWWTNQTYQYIYTVNVSYGSNWSTQTINWTDTAQPTVWNITIDVPSAVESILYTNYSNDYFSFKYANNSPYIYNISAIGESDRIVSEVNFSVYDASLVAYNFSNFSSFTEYNDTYLQKIGREFDMDTGGTSVGRVRQTIVYWPDNQTIDLEVQVRALANHTINKSDLFVYFDNANQAVRKNTSAFETETIGADSSVHWNREVTTNYVTDNSNNDFLTGVNTSNGFVFVAMSGFCKNSIIGGGTNQKCDPNWMLEDCRWDSSCSDTIEVENDKYDDRIYVQGQHNVTFHDESTPYIRATVLYEDSSTTYADSTSAVRNWLYPQDVEEGAPTADDVFRFHVTFYVGNSSENIQTSMNSFQSAVTDVSGEVWLHGNMFAEDLGLFYVGNALAGGVGINKTSTWYTVYRLASDIVDNTTHMFKTHYLMCDFLTEKIEEDGALIYGPIKAAGYGGGINVFGNANEAKDSCLRVWNASRLGGYPDAKSHMRQRWLNSSTSSQENTQGMIYRDLIVNISTDDTSVTVDRSVMTPGGLFYDESDYSTPGIMRIKYTGNRNATELWISEILCHDESGSVLWDDDFSTDTSGNYSFTDGSTSFTETYNSTIGAIQIIDTKSIGAIGTMRIAAEPSWDNHSCQFNITSANNVTDINGHTLLDIVLKENSSVEYIKFRLYDSGDEGARLLRNGSTKQTTKFNWFERNVSAGRYDCFWGAGYENSSACRALWATANAWEFAGFGERILNIELYTDSDASEDIVLGIQENNTAKLAEDRAILKSSIIGLNWRTYTEHVTKGVANAVYRSIDYMLTYSIDQSDKDGGYFELAFKMLAKLLRLLDGEERIHDIPAACYYARNFRFNQSETSSSSEFYKSMAHIGAVDYRCTQYMFTSGGGDLTISENSKVYFLTNEEYELGIAYKESNCTDAFDGKMGIHYVDNHVKLSYPNSMRNLTEVCDNIRMTDESNVTIHEAFQYQLNTTFEVDLSMFDPMTHDINFSFLEAYPKANSRTSNSYWNFTLSRVALNGSGTCNNISRFSITGNGTGSFASYDCHPSDTLFVAINGTDVLNFSTDANGYGTFQLSSDLSTGLNLVTISTEAAAAGDSCDTNTWDCSEGCTVDGLDAGGSAITTTGTGSITISADVTNCNTGGNYLTVNAGCTVTVQAGVELCTS